MHTADIPPIDVAAIYPPLTRNEARVLAVLTSDCDCELSAEMIAEMTGLGAARAQQALGSLASRRPPLVDGSQSNRVVDAWQPVRYSVAITRI